ncbi:MAG: arsenic efflux protein [Clostridia bacterium]|nr:arsenic efflux protein [Clostridia bacterium]
MGINMEIIREILLEALLDSVKLIPVLFLVYLLIEYLEHKNNNGAHHLFMKSGKAGPLYGGLFGCIPQCGFSVIASELYSKKAITLGTLVAIFVSTSDEAIPILLAEPRYFKQMLLLIGAKLLIALIFGFAIDLLYKSGDVHKACEHKDHEHIHYHGNCEDCHDGVLKSAIIHCIKIFVFIFLVSVVLGFLMEYLGDFVKYVSSNNILQVLITPIVGLIPNCAASVVLTQLYIEGGITLGALTGGLCAGAGVGLVVLLKLNRNQKENLKIIGIMYLIGVISGAVINLIEVL